MTDPLIEQFDTLFDRVIAPALAPYEAERRKVIATFWRWMMLGGIASAVIAIVLAVLARDGEIVGLGFFGAVMSAVFAYPAVHRFEERCKAAALGDLARTLDMTYEVADFLPPAFHQIVHLGLLPDDYETSEFEDLFGGRRSRADFQLYEGRLTKRNGKSTTTLFRGQILRIGFPKTFLGTTIVNRQAQRRWRGEGFQRVGLESSQFERIFEVFGTDQVEARFLVHPAFMERLMALETAMSGRNLRCAFNESHLLVAIEGGDLFEVVDVFKPLPDREQTRKGIEELRAVLGLIDAILAPPPNVWADAGKA